MTEKHIQYTLRQVPPHVNSALRKKADEEHKSLNEVTLRALERGLNLADQALRHHDLDDLAGTWVEDPEFDRAIEEMDQIDTELWQ